MTKYQQKRRFINKMNARVRTLTSRAGVDIEHIFNRIEGIDGVWVTDNNLINIDTSYYTPELEKRLESLIPTYQHEIEEVRKDYKTKVDPDFIGPATPVEHELRKAVQAKFEFEDAFDEYIYKYYEMRDSVNPADYKANATYQRIEKELSSIGRAWNHEPDYIDILSAFRELEKIKY